VASKLNKMAQKNFGLEQYTTGPKLEQTPWVCPCGLLKLFLKPNNSPPLWGKKDTKTVPISLGSCGLPRGVIGVDPWGSK